MEHKHLNLGLFGFGCVGQGLFDTLEQTQGMDVEIKKICVKDKSKKRKIDMSNFTFERNDIMDRDDLTTIVELIDTSKEAFDIVSKTLTKGIDVVTANKKMLAENFEALFNLQNEHNASLLYEGSVGGSIPILRNLEEYYDNDFLSNIQGILNGSSNFITSLMRNDGLEYDEALEKATEEGFAESDPWLDVAGFDSLYKLILLVVHGFGVILKPEEVLNLGIQNISFHDIQFAKEKNLKIKLIASAYKHEDKFRVYVLPKFIGREDQLFGVDQEYNAVSVQGAFSDVQVLVGKGAGSFPTGSAVLSDVSALSYDYRYEYKKLRKRMGNGGQIYGDTMLDNDFDIRLYIRFRDRSSLDEIDIVDIQEEYKSSKTNYIIADVKFKSLFALKDNRKSELFICAV